MSTEKHHFELVLEADASEDGFLDEVADSLIDAGCDDATFSVRYGVPHAEFRREAATLARAVLSAIADVESVLAVEVLRVGSDELLTATEIAARTGRSRQSIHQLISGKRGPGGFPQAADWVHGAKLWRSTQVGTWFSQLPGERVFRYGAGIEFLGALNGTLQTRHFVRSLKGADETCAVGAFLRWDLSALEHGNEEGHPAKEALEALGSKT